MVSLKETTIFLLLAVLSFLIQSARRLLAGDPIFGGDGKGDDAAAPTCAVRGL